MKQQPAKFSLNSFIDMLATLPTDKACREYLESKIWGEEPVCPHCGSQNKDHYQLKVKGEFNGLYKCKEKGCKQRFTVTIGTMFEGSHIGLRKWFIAIYIFSLHKKGISSHQLASDLGITQKSAWFMLHRIRQAFGQKKDVLSNTVEIDETFMGGQASNKHSNKKTKTAAGGTAHEKQPVLGMRERGGKVMAVVVPNRNKETILPVILSTVEEGSTIMTDEYTAYKDLKYTHGHFTVNHGAKEYVNKMAHTNGIENFWSHLKRGVDGIYHWVSKEHLQSYVDEFIFRFNSRNDSTNEKFDYSLKYSNKLTYKSLISKQ